MRSHVKVIVAVSALLLTIGFGASSALSASPVVTIDPSPVASYVSAEVKGTVDPQDLGTNWSFEYSKNPATEGWSGFAYQGYAEPPAGAQNVSATLTGLQPGTEYQVRLVANNFSDPEVISLEPNPIFTTKAVGAPVLTIDPVTTFDDTTATFTGSVDPEATDTDPAFDVNWHFECVPACPGFGGGTIPADNGGLPDSDVHTVEAPGGGLEPNTDYEVKLVASNAAGPVSTGSVSFHTDSAAPKTQTFYAGELSTQSATLSGRVNPGNAATSYFFEWGSDASYGNTTPSVPLGSTANSFQFVTAPVTGLEAGHTYHFRLVAINTFGEEAQGIDHALQALSPFVAKDPLTCPNDLLRVGPSRSLPDCRAYEMVSPPDKNGGDIERDVITTFATSRGAADGSAVAYSSVAQFGDLQAATIYNQYLSRRTESGWATRGITPPKATTSLVRAPRTVAFSDDLAQSIVTTASEIDQPSAFLPEGLMRLYRQDNSGTASTYQLASRASVPVPYTTLVDAFDFGGASSGFQKIAFTSTSVPLTADAGPAGQAAYEWVDGQTKLVSILPSGEPATVDAVIGARQPRTGEQIPGENPVSADGRRVFFSVFAPQNFGSLYVREDGTTTRVISASERSGDDPTEVRSAVFQAASKSDGAVALFASEVALTDDAVGVSGTPTLGNLYRWEADAPSGHHLSTLTPNSLGLVLGVSATSDDLNTVYFVATNTLAPGASFGEPNLYVSKPGELRFIATLDGGPHPIGGFHIRDEAVWSNQRKIYSARPTAPMYRDARATPDGAHFLFVSYKRLTSDAVEGRKQVYLYDASIDGLSCVSCHALVGSTSSGAELFGLQPAVLNDAHAERTGPLNLPRNLSEDGRSVVFETAERLVTTDNNQRIDVYQWENGRVDLLSTGASAEDSLLIDLSSNGNDVFFTTRDRLSPRDRDDNVDAYDARINGGFAEQGVSTECVADQCQGDILPVQPSPAPGTASPVAGGNHPPCRAKNRHGQKKKKRKSGCNASKPGGHGKKGSRGHKRANSGRNS